MAWWPSWRGGQGPTICAGCPNSIASTQGTNALGCAATLDECFGMGNRPARKAMILSSLRAILDSVAFEAERSGLKASPFLKQLAETEDFLCSITVAELAHGIYRAPTS